MFFPEIRDIRVVTFSICCPPPVLYRKVYTVPTLFSTNLKWVSLYFTVVFEDRFERLVQSVCWLAFFQLVYTFHRVSPPLRIEALRVSSVQINRCTKNARRRRRTPGLCRSFVWSPTGKYSTELGLVRLFNHRKRLRYFFLPKTLPTRVLTNRLVGVPVTKLFSLPDVWILLTL